MTKTRLLLITCFCAWAVFAGLTWASPPLDEGPSPELRDAQDAFWQDGAEDPERWMEMAANSPEHRWNSLTGNALFVALALTVILLLTLLVRLARSGARTAGSD